MDSNERDYAEAMWKWIEKTLKSSTDFDFLFVAGHYMLLDSIGYYDAVLVSRLLPLLKTYNVSAYIQGHRHSLEHVQGQWYTDVFPDIFIIFKRPETSLEIPVQRVQL